MFRFSKFALALATLCVLGLASAITAEAVPVVIVDRATYQTNNPSRTDITFGGSSVPYASSLTFSGATFAGQNGHQVGVINGSSLHANFAGNYVLNTAGGIVPSGTNMLQITLPAGTTAVAFDILCGNGTQVPNACAGTYEVIVNGMTFQAPSLMTNQFAFFGVTDTAGITSLAIRLTGTGGGPPILDNFSFSPAAGDPEPVPEPATMVLFGTGLAGVASVARKRRLRARKTDEDVAVG